MSIPRAGVAVVAVSANAAPAYYTAILSARVPVTPGETMTAAASVWSVPGTVTGATVRVMIRFYDALTGGATVSESYASAPTSTEGQRLVHQAVVPPSAVACAIILWYVNATTVLPASSGPWSWWDAITLDAAATDGSWFDLEVDAEYNRVLRSVDGGLSWQLVADQIPLNGSLLDRAAYSHGETLYRIVAVSATPTKADSLPISLDADSCWIWISGGPGLDILARGRANAGVGATRGRPKVLHRFVGDDAVTEFASLRGRERRWDISVEVAAHVDDVARVERWDTWPAWDIVADLPAPLLYRDALGRRAYVSIGDVNVRHKAGDPYATISTTVTRAQHVE